MKVLVVGLNPSRKHGQSGTLKRLYTWLDKLRLKTVSFINLYDDYEIDYRNSKAEYIKHVSKRYDRVIALGKGVSDSLHDLAVDHFMLPHPSGLNRKLNDKKFVHDQLTACKNYLQGGA